MLVIIINKFYSINILVLCCLFENHMLPIGHPVDQGRSLIGNLWRAKSQNKKALRAATVTTPSPPIQVGSLAITLVFGTFYPFLGFIFCLLLKVLLNIQKHLALLDLLLK